ncbi:MAG: hypothetical protein JEZ04_05915 [Spirochaetales bacterium]|nr:hypothetical protein [Spirochaetales bacterium]
MKTARFFKITLTLLILTAMMAACIGPDYFSAYYAKNLVGHKLLSTWAVNQSSIYIKYEAVTTASTTGLPDETALIYRLENRNLVPNGDFEGIAPGPLLPAGWAEFGTGTNSIAAAVPIMTGQALSFALTGSDYIEYSLNTLTAGLITDGTYLFRFDLAGAAQSYKFNIDDTAPGGTLVTYFFTLPTANLAYAIPESISTAPLTEFLVHSNLEVFRINSKLAGTGTPQTGYIDNFRVIKSDQVQELAINLPFEDAERVDSLNLLSGTYRFSLWVKSDTDAATTNNSFNSKAVTLKMEAFDPDGTGGSVAFQSFSASDYSSFTGWTQIYIDAVLQIDEPADTANTVIKLSVSPCDCTGGAITTDTGSILISTPELLYSSNGTF